MKPRVSIREALEDPQLLGGALPGESWLLWRVLLIAAMGEALTEDERKLFESVTGRPEAPHERVDEFWNIVVGAVVVKRVLPARWGLISLRYAIGVIVLPQGSAACCR